MTTSHSSLQTLTPVENNACTTPSKGKVAHLLTVGNSEVSPLWYLAMNSLRPVSLIIAFLLSAGAAQAQTYIFGRADFPVGTAPISVAVGDFNGDGIIDLAVVNEADSTVSIPLGKPDGTFAPQVTYATGLGPLAIVTGDFNGDGNLDLAVTNGNCVMTEGGPICDGHTVSILLGNGDGSFQTHVDYPTGIDPSAIAAGDFNGDGKLDLAVANTQDNTVSVLLGMGMGHFRLRWCIRQ